MSNGVRRTKESGLMASAGSQYSKKYKKLQKKLGVKGKAAPGALLQAARPAIGSAVRGAMQGLAKQSSAAAQGYKVGGKTVSSQEFRRIGQNKLDAWRNLKPIGRRTSPSLPRRVGRGVRRVVQGVKNAPKTLKQGVKAVGSEFGRGLKGYKKARKSVKRKSFMGGGFRGLHGGVDDRRTDPRRSRGEIKRTAGLINRFNRDAVGRKK